MKLMTQYDWDMNAEEIMADPSQPIRIVLKELETGKEVRFLIANSKVLPHRVALHMDSLTDTLCEQWFDEALSVEERKAKQKMRKEQARKEREEIERVVAEQKRVAAEAKAAEKAAEKARRAARNK